jgi:VCBS repeat-containing protein
MKRLSVLVFFAVALMSARPVSAQRGYFDGTWTSNYTFCPVTGNLVTVLNTYVGYYTDPNEPYPRTGDLGYVHAVAANVAPCVNDAPGFDFFLPEGATLAISASNPVYCIRGRYSDGYWEYVPNDANGGCSQTPLAGTYGGYFFGWSALPPGWYLDIRVPVTYNKHLLGPGGPNSHRLTAVTSSAYGALTPYQPVTTFYRAEFLNLASTVTNTSANVGFNLRSYYKDGLLYVDYGTTASFGSSLPAVNIPSTGLEFPVSANLAGLTPGTPYYWRARYVTTSGTFTSPTQNFTTTGSATPQTLTVSKTGTGVGTVTSNPAGIACGATCSAQFAYNTAVTLTAAGATGSRFTSWTAGPCAGSTNAVCAVTMNQARSVTAAFSRDLGSLSLTVGGLPAGNSVLLGITGPDGFNQTRTVLTGTGVNLSDVPTGVYTVTAPTTSINGTTYVPAQATQSVTVNFGLTATAPVTYSAAVSQQTLTVSKSGTGTGTVTSNPAGIACGATCSAGFNQGTSVTLTATPGAGAVFSGWSGACTGSGTCIVSMTVARSVNAAFAQANQAPSAVPDSYSTGFATALTIVAPGVLANDSDANGDPMTAVSHSAPAHGTLTPNANGSFVYTPAAGFSGTDSFTYRASDGTALSAPATVTITVGQPTSVQPPTQLLASSVTGNVVTLRWTPPAVGPSPTGYLLEGGVNPNEVLASIPTNNAAPIFTFVAPSGSFYVRIHALAGADRSAASNEVRIHVNVPVPPSAPTGVVALVNGSTLNLAWRNTFTGGAPTSLLLDVTGAAVTTVPLAASDGFAFAGVPGGTYTLRLRAANAGGTSAASTPVTVTFPGACSGAPLTPVDVLVYRVGATAFVVWNPAPTGPAPVSYTVDVSGDFVGSVDTPGRAVSGTVGPGSYTFRVTAVNACGASASSTPQTLVVP